MSLFRNSHESWGVSCVVFTGYCSVVVVFVIDYSVDMPYCYVILPKKERLER